MLQFIEMAADFFETIFLMIFQTIRDINYVITLMTGVTSQLPFMLKYLPGPVAAIVAASCAFAIIAKILGRDG